MRGNESSIPQIFLLACLSAEQFIKGIALGSHRFRARTPTSVNLTGLKKAPRESSRHQQLLATKRQVIEQLLIFGNTHLASVWQPKPIVGHGNAGDDARLTGTKELRLVPMQVPLADSFSCFEQQTPSGPGTGKHDIIDVDRHLAAYRLCQRRKFIKQVFVRKI